MPSMKTKKAQDTKFGVAKFKRHHITVSTDLEKILPLSKTPEQIALDAAAIKEAEANEKPLPVDLERVKLQNLFGDNQSQILYFTKNKEPHGWASMTLPDEEGVSYLENYVVREPDALEKEFLDALIEHVAANGGNKLMVDMDHDRNELFEKNKFKNISVQAGCPLYERYVR